MNLRNYTPEEALRVTSMTTKAEEFLVNFKAFLIDNCIPHAYLYEPSASLEFFEDAFRTYFQAIKNQGTDDV